MSINIRTNISPTMKSLSEQGTFRNAMYQQDKEKQEKQEKHKTSVHQSVAKNVTPVHLIKNEEFRLMSAGLQCELNHVEEQMSIAQTVASALLNVENSLIQIKELLVIVSSETEHNTALREADQQELEQLIKRINKVADETSYGHQPLLDGSHGVRGVANGEFLEFIDMNPDSKTSPLAGYEVFVKQAATRAELCGQTPLTQKMVDNGELLIFEESGIENRFSAQKGESVCNTFNRLANWIYEREIPLEIVPNADQILHIRHLQYGSSYKFSASSFTPGLISLVSQRITPSSPGLDVMGTINGITCVGHGQFLSVPVEHEHLGGLTIMYTGNETPPEYYAGTVSVAQNGFQFLSGNNTSQVQQLSLRNMHASSLGMEIENVSGFKSLQEINILSGQKIKDSISVLEKSMKEISVVKDKVESICYETFKNKIKDLQEEYGSILFTNQNPVIGQNVQVLAEQTKNRISEDSGQSSMAQAHQNHKTVLSLLK